MAPFDRPHTSSYWRSAITIYGPILYRLRDKPDSGRKLGFLHTPPAFDVFINGYPVAAVGISP